MRSYFGRLSFFLLIVGIPVSLGGMASAVTIDWVGIGNSGNACDVQTQGCFGAVTYAYQISKYEVTNAQYTEFLNAVADTDTNALYSATMTTSPLGGINQAGLPGSFTYTVKTGFADMPVNFVSFYDSLRFANWLHNGQLNTGSQTAATTEDGSYTFTGATTVGARNVGATIVLTSESEWYKAAYYNALGVAYFDYPAGSDTTTTCTTPTAAANSANCGTAVGALTDGGSYTGSASPYGTFDQGGNVFEWNEAMITATRRGLRGGSLVSADTALAAATRVSAFSTVELNSIGFRVANVPEPSTGVLLMMGLLGVSGWRRRQGV
jgi:formylglycine-generating enzyme required for sulfatase activity